MKSLIDDEYLNKLNEQSKNSRISRKYQLMGLLIADLLNDKAHKALYIKLAKEYDPPAGEGCFYAQNRKKRSLFYGYFKTGRSLVQ